MRIIKIVANNIEIDFVASSLTLKTENNAFSTDFKVTHTSFPFLIIENTDTKKALGPKDITSINKKKVIDVDVFELDVKYKGQLQVLSYINGFRKCNLKYASEILPLLSQPIKNFMPIVSVIPGETEPVTYLEEATEVTPGSEHWPAYVAPYLNFVFPQVKWQFPTLSYDNLFADERNPEDAWFLYQRKINKVNYNAGTYQLIENEYQIESNVLDVQNRNVVAPQIFLLTPLYYIFNSIGFKIKGNAISNAFLRRVLFLSFANNLTKVNLLATQTPVILPTGAFTNWNIIDQNYQPSKIADIVTGAPGTFKLKYYLKIYSPEDNVDSYSEGKLYLSTADGEVITIFNLHIDSNDRSFWIFEGEALFNVSVASASSINRLVYVNDLQQMPMEYDISVSLEEDNKTYYQMHPTIDTSRYVPDWTVADYLNELKKTFNISIDPDDYKKEVSFSLNENIAANVTPEILNKSLKVSSYSTVANTSFTLKYANNEDDALFITSDSAEVYTNQIDDFNKLIQNKFKFVPSNYFTTELSEALEDKDGVGLMLYDVARIPNTSDNYLGNTLKFTGAGNLYVQFWKKWLKFRLSASSLEIEGPFTRQEIQKFANKKEIYIDHQHYRVVSYEFTEQTPGVNIVKFSLESVNL